MRTQKFVTKALHARHDVFAIQETRAVPIYQTTSYVFKDTDHVTNLFNLSEPEYIYTQLNNPTNEVLEQCLEGQSGIITFGVKGGFDSAKTVTNETKIFSLLANIGDTKSLIIHPASTTHQQLDSAQQESIRVTQDLIRLSVGLEGVEDLKEDLKNSIC